MELADIEQLVYDQRPHRANSELNRYLADNPMTPEAAEVKMRIEGMFSADAAAWDKAQNESIDCV
jgi:hypothetical protein